MSEWLPIEIAPNDGTIVLLYVPGGVQERVSFDYGHVSETLGCFSAAERQAAQWISIEAVTEYHDYGGMTGISVWTEQIAVSPTHWMPLPAAPVAGGE